MSGSKSKEELTKFSKENFEKLNNFIASLPHQEKGFPEGTMNRNIRDVLTHLHH